MNTTNSGLKYIMIGALVLFVALAIAAALTMPDRRSAGEKVGDAIGKLDEGVDDAGRELQSRTPIERMDDEVKDATDGSPQ
jgi:hypothetical protein